MEPSGHFGGRELKKSHITITIAITATTTTTVTEPEGSTRCPVVPRGCLQPALEAASPRPSEQDCFVQPGLPWGQITWMDHIMVTYQFLCAGKRGQARGYALTLKPNGRAHIAPAWQTHLLPKTGWPYPDCLARRVLGICCSPHSTQCLQLGVGTGHASSWAIPAKQCRKPRGSAQTYTPTLTSTDVAQMTS